MSKKQTKRMMNSGFSDWKAAQLPDLTGKCYVITGANSGIGFEAAKILLEAGADTVLACRSRTKGEQAKAKLQALNSGNVDLVRLDLSDLSSVRQAADQIRSKYSKIDGLINNAGIMQTPKLKTADGFEMQVGTNHLGHFLWTGLLLDLVEAAKGRVVVVASLAHKFGSLNLEDYMSEKNYSSSGAYVQSKLSNMLFAFELDRRLKAAGKQAICIACHPGYAGTNLQSTGPRGIFNVLYKFMNPLFSQPAEKGALPTVLAAAGKEAIRGGYYGPQQMGESRGRVSDATVAPSALNREHATKLWELSEALVDFHWDVKA